MAEFELNLNMEELEKRTSKEYLTEKKMLSPDSKEYLELDENDNHYLEKLITTVAMKMVEEEVQAIGSVDIERINRVLKNSSFSVVKIVP